MASKHRVLKQWALTHHETVTTIENWRQNLICTLLSDNSFEPFVREGAEWQKKSRDNPTRGFTDDDDDNPLTAAAKCARLELMLGQIANYCPVISRNSTSLPQI